MYLIYLIVLLKCYYGLQFFNHFQFKILYWVYPLLSTLYGSMYRCRGLPVLTVIRANIKVHRECWCYNGLQYHINLFNVQFCFEFNLYAPHAMLCSTSTFYSLHSTSYFQCVYDLPSTLLAHPCSTLYVLPATRSMLYDLPSKSIYALLSTFYQLLSLML